MDNNNNNNDGSNVGDGNEYDSVSDGIRRGGTFSNNYDRPKTVSKKGKDGGVCATYAICAVLRVPAFVFHIDNNSIVVVVVSIAVDRSAMRRLRRTATASR